MLAGDKRLLTSRLSLSTVSSITQVPEGSTITIQQVDERGKKVLIENVWVSDWKVEQISVPVIEVETT